MIRQLLDGLHYLHKRRIIHTNITPKSVIVDDLLSCTVRLCHFDQAIVLPVGLSEAQRAAFKADEDLDMDIQFNAPEMFGNGDVTVSYQTDLWSVAAIAAMLLIGDKPFAGPNEAAKIKAGEWRSDDLYENVDKAAFKFLMQTLKSVPMHRLTAEEAQEHRWLSLSEDATKLRSAISFSTAKLRNYNNSRN